MPLSFLIEKFIFRPITLNPAYIFTFEKPFEELNFLPEKDIKINALHFKAQKSKGIILYFHGNKDNLKRWGKIASELVNFNYDVIVIDYRGYGKSNGERTEENMFSDALFCYNEIKVKFKPDKLVLFGRSLGTGIASWLAGKVNPNKLILETPYFDMHHLLGNYVPQGLYKNKLNFRFTSHVYLHKTNFPIMILHGTADEVVPYKSGQKLYESIHNPNKIFCFFIGGKHNDLNRFDSYWKQLKEFLE